MKLIPQILLILTLSFSMHACQKIEGPAKNIFQTWEVKEFVSTESTNYSKREDSPIYLTIHEDQSYSLKLDANICQGSLLRITDLSIIFESPACTEICCDSPFSSHLADLLPFISMYKVQDNILRLSISDWGFIECERVD
ncbi:hypothetical protein [Mangrovibacterium lignilyticum]|uniref:hypothetical protein n=1 Tax=Mangrovibacterium lignilyticum TaxID=2668052 RepID=UPI0013D74F53|nr:hypothetical protein [Mangrovibacterium lignilyticum]